MALSQKTNTRLQILKTQENLFFYPHQAVQKAYERIYKKGETQVGWPKGVERYKENYVDNTCAFVGIALGDEGKGRLVDNKIEEMLQNPGIEKVYVIRWNGGNNAGHTIEKDGIKIALHSLPSFPLHKKAIGIIDRGTAVNPQDFVDELLYVEQKTESLKKRIYISGDAILLTDLEKAEEELNNGIAQKSKGGTGRGIAPAYAHKLDRKGLMISDLMAENWKEKLEKYYDDRKTMFKAYRKDLDKCLVADFGGTKRTGHQQKREIGSKEQFIKRLAEARAFLQERKIATNTRLVHNSIYRNPKIGVIFEGAQAIGLHPELGTYPDVTSSNPTLEGIRGGTGVWLPNEIKDKVGVFKLTYMSSVGSRKEAMPTYISLPEKEITKTAGLNTEQLRALFVRNVANEKGTSTGRYRDIYHLDLEMMRYNLRMSGGVEVLTATHVDIAQEKETIKVCTHYTDENGAYMPYQPGLNYIKNAKPHYVKLPGWDGKACTKAKCFEDLPQNAIKFLAFVQEMTGYPITIATNGPLRKNIIYIKTNK
ncbi:adenylosuccinate synthetase [Candidatus Parcubacteria bacterium]|nr:MAG: adenylosuccinate synthetase [Candidatus Parcubacteria bacterium]